MRVLRAIPVKGLFANESGVALRPTLTSACIVQVAGPCSCDERLSVCPPASPPTTRGPVASTCCAVPHSHSATAVVAQPPDNERLCSPEFVFILEEYHCTVIYCLHKHSTCAITYQGLFTRQENYSVTKTIPVRSQRR